MTKKHLLGRKILAFVMSLLLLFNFVPMRVLASEISNGIKSLGSRTVEGEPPTSLEDVKIPTVTENPYDLDVFVESYPIYNDSMHEFFDGFIHNYLSRYGTHDIVPDGQSPYYTASIAPWYDYEIWIDRDDDMIIESDLPYREGRESIAGGGSSMFHSELTLTNGGINVRLINDYRHLNSDSFYKEILTDYLEKNLGLNMDQVYVRISATLLSGSGGIFVSSPESDIDYSTTGRVTDENTVKLTLDVPLKDFDIWTIIYFDADRSPNNVMTDFHITLIDNTSPSVNSMTVTREVREDYTADLVLTMKMNESLRFAHENVKNELDNIWVELELLDLLTNKKSNVRLYIEDFDGDRTLTFRGDIGLYNYKNFRVNRVTKANFAGNNRRTEYALIDLADEKYISAYETVDHDNRIIKLETFDGANLNRWATAICDFACNSINAASITNWSFGDQSYISNTFEAVDVKIYNERTVGFANGEQASADAERADMLAGPANELFVYVYLDQYLTEEEAKQVSIELNVLNPNGTPLVAWATSSSDYRFDEVYGGSSEGTLIRFENIPLCAGMKLDMEEGIDTEPLIRVTKMTDEIDGKMALASVVAPSNKMYADFTAPEVAIEKYAATEHEADGDNGKCYTVTLAINIEDVNNYSQIAGILGTRANISVGGGVDKVTSFKYLLSGSSLPPEDASGYGSQAELAPNGMCAVGKVTLIEASPTWYLHLLVESGELYIDDIFVAVEAEDIAGNITEFDPPDEIEYLIDEIAPDLKVTSQSMEAANGNTEMDVTIGISASDRNAVERIHYYVERDVIDGESPVWIPLVIESGKEVEDEIILHYGGLDHESNRTYSDTIWIKATDEYGNESQPIAYYVNVNLEKPSTDVSYEGNLNLVSNAHRITVTGPKRSSGDDIGYTRITLTPLDSPEYSYVTVVGTGEAFDVLSFVGQEWYRVKTEFDRYTEVSLPETVTDDYELTEESVLYGLLGYYGELKISFENGYGDMTPTVGPLYAAANAGSYAADPNYYVVRFASPYLSGMTVHSVDFGKIVDRDGVTVVADADPGNPVYKYNQSRKGINPMRNTAIYFTLSNLARADFGLLDFDYESSYMEFIRVGENGGDTVVARRDGLSAGASQFFMIKNETDSGEYYTTGAYYLRVTVFSHSGMSDSYESSRIILDAQTPDNAGVWRYSYQTNVDITSIKEEKGYTWVTKDAEGEAFNSLGISVKIGGEDMRSSVFAVYSFGVSGISFILSAPGTAGEYEDIAVGGVKGFKVWNLASNPTRAEIDAQPFAKDLNGDFLSCITGTDDIYSTDNIPKGAEGFGDLYLIKGINTICYQVAMENGYVSPIRQFTIIVTDYTPELNIAIDDYIPSHQASQLDGVVNASSIRFFVETAYSMNGTGEVSVDLWSNYGMNVGSFVDGELVDSFLDKPSSSDEPTSPDEPSSSGQDIGILKKGMKVEEYADFTMNSYTSDFPEYQMLCTALFVATDEYGGVTIVAPQIGDHIRCGTGTGSQLDEEYNINYARYFGDPYTIGDSDTSKRMYYNQPIYFGNELLRFENSIYKNVSLGVEEFIETTMISNSELKYNLFNIVTNDITWSTARDYNLPDRTSARVTYQDGKNLELINWDSATITFFNGDLSTPVTLPLAGGDNDVGYMGASINSVTGLTFYVANPCADEKHPAGTADTRNYTISCRNIYGNTFETSSEVTLYYVDYGIDSVKMTEYGAELSFSFETREYGTAVRTGMFKNGQYSIDVTDLYGNLLSIDYSITNSRDPDTQISFSEISETADQVIVTLSRNDGRAIFVDINDYDIMSVENNSTSSVTVTAKKNTRFSYRYLDSDKNECMYFITVDNIREPAPYLVWNYNEDEVNEGEDGMKYRYGSVTVYLADNSFSLVDNYTGRAPSFTFTPGGNRSYTFSADEISAILGDDAVKLPYDITATLDITLYEIPDPLGKIEEDKESPNVQLLAYSNLNGVYSEERLALQLENARNSNALNDYPGYTNLEFLGNRADTNEILDILGWSTSYRFVIETVDMSRTRIFIKQGLYADAPDYETGISDSIDGVHLNSKLLTITKNAKFSLFVVDASNNYSSIAFDVTDVGEAPSPDIVKVPLTNELVRAYIVAPEGAEEFEIIGSITVGYESDIESEYYGRPYVEYSDNDYYTVNYRMLYNGVTIESAIDLTVDEINLREISLIGGVEWSANNNLEATNKDIIATVCFTENVKELFVLGEYNSDAVSFMIAGNTVSAIYSDNHPEITLEFVSESGSFVQVSFGAVTNIDKGAAVLDITERTLAKNGKSVTVTIVADERVISKEGGFAGEEIDGKYYFTKTLTANGLYTFSFSDMTSNISQISVEITEIVTEELSAEYSLSSDGASAVSTPEELEVMIGDSVYIKPVRYAIATLSDGTTVELPADAWTEITIPEIFGGIQPYIILIDEYGNVLTHQFSKIEVPDTTAPDVVINKTVYSVRVGTDRAVVESELLANFAAFDNEEGEIQLSVQFTEEMSVTGVSTVKYIATDASGNTTVKEGKLRITSIYEPVVHYGEIKLSRDDGVIVESGEDIKLLVDCAGLSYRVVIKEGIRTAAQMKEGVTEITDYTLDGELVLGGLESGIYTICIINQNRDYFRIIISVE